MTDTLRQGIDKAVEFNKTFFHGIYIEVKAERITVWYYPLAVKNFLLKSPMKNDCRKSIIIYLETTDF